MILPTRSIKGTNTIQWFAYEILNNDYNFVKWFFKQENIFKKF
jgi:hypothetical protein